jgi:ribonuclease HI
VLVDGERQEERSGRLEETSANRLELLAACQLLEKSAAGGVRVYTPSTYLRDGAAKWLPGWRRRGFKTSSGEAVKNRDLWQRLEAAQAERRVEWPPPDADALPLLQRAEALAQAALQAQRR